MKKVISILLATALIFAVMCSPALAASVAPSNDLSSADKLTNDEINTIVQKEIEGYIGTEVDSINLMVAPPETLLISMILMGTYLHI